MKRDRQKKSEVSVKMLHARDLYSSDPWRKFLPASELGVNPFRQPNGFVFAGSSNSILVNAFYIGSRLLYHTFK